MQLPAVLDQGPERGYVSIEMLPEHSGGTVAMLEGEA